MRVYSLVVIALLTVFAASTDANAEVPRRLNFQAILLDSVESVVPDGNYELIFRIFDAEVGGTELWTETQVLPTQNGLFNTFLGLSFPVPDSVFSGPDRWLEIQLAENSEPYEPRGKIGSVAYSYRVGSVNGATGGSITGQVVIEGGSSTITFTPSAVGNASVGLPDDAVSSQEILDEPGLAQRALPGDFDLTFAPVMSDVVVCTLTIPAPGFILVEANGQARFEGTNVNAPNFFEYQIDETAGGGLDSNYYQRVGFAAPPTISNVWLPLAIRRSYYKAAPGQYVFRLEASTQSEEGTRFIWNPLITAMYIPRAYGAVVTPASISDPGVPANAKFIEIQGDNEANPGPARQTYEADLSVPE